MFRALLQSKGAGHVLPVNPREATVEGVATTTLRAAVEGRRAEDVAVSIVTPPAASLEALKEAIDLKIGVKKGRAEK